MGFWICANRGERESGHGWWRSSLVVMEEEDGKTQRFPFAAATGAAARRRGGFVPISSANLPIVISLIAPLLKQKKKRKKKGKTHPCLYSALLCQPFCGSAEVGAAGKQSAERQRKSFRSCEETLRTLCSSVGMGNERVLVSADVGRRWRGWRGATSRWGADSGCV